MSSKPRASGETSERRETPLSKKLLLLLCSVLVSALLAEVVVRLAAPKRSYDEWRRASIRYDYHPDYHWTIRPGEYGNGAQTIKISPAGTREPMPPKARVAGKLRLLCLGGSSTFNHGATKGLTWCVRLGQALTKRLGKETEVINAGTPGYSSYQSSQRYEKQLAAWKPDLVVIYHMWNDLKVFALRDPPAIIKKWDLHGKFNGGSSLLDPFPFLDGITKYSQALTHARLGWVRAKRAYWNSQRNVDLEGWTFNKLNGTVEPAALAFFRDNHKRVVDVSKAAGIPTFIVDQLSLLRPNLPPQYRRMINYRYIGFTHDVAVDAVRQGRKVLDELATAEPKVFRIKTDQIPVGPQIMRDHVHLTDQGLAVLAGAMANGILAVWKP